MSVLLEQDLDFNRVQFSKISTRKHRRSALHERTKIPRLPSQRGTYEQKGEHPDKLRQQRSSAETEGRPVNSLKPTVGHITPKRRSTSDGFESTNVSHANPGVRQSAAVGMGKVPFTLALQCRRRNNDGQRWE